jgi:hypothetical protein
VPLLAVTWTALLEPVELDVVSTVVVPVVEVVEVDAAEVVSADVLAARAMAAPVTATAIPPMAAVAWVIRWAPRWRALGRALVGWALWVGLGLVVMVSSPGPELLMPMTLPTYPLGLLCPSCPPPTLQRHTFRTLLKVCLCRLSTGEGLHLDRRLDSE